MAGLVVSRRSSSRRGAPRPGFIALASARAGRVADAPVFLLADEKVFSGRGWVGRFSSFVVQFGVPRRDRTVQHTSGLNYYRSPPARSELLVRPAPVRGEARREARAVRTERFGLLLCGGQGQFR